MLRSTLLPTTPHAPHRRRQQAGQRMAREPDRRAVPIFTCSGEHMQADTRGDEGWSDPHPLTVTSRRFVSTAKQIHLRPLNVHREHEQTESASASLLRDGQKGDTGGTSAAFMVAHCSMYVLTSRCFERSRPRLLPRATSPPPALPDGHPRW